MQLFVKKGSYDATSTTDICRAAKIARASLYHYFGSKKNIFLSLYIDHMDRVLKPYLDNAASVEDPLLRLEYMVHTFTQDVIGRHPELTSLIHDSFAMKDRCFITVRREWKRYYLLLCSTISQLQEQGKAQKDISPSRAALFVLGLMTWSTFWIDFDREEQISKIADQAVDFVLRAAGCTPTR